MTTDTKNWHLFKELSDKKRLMIIVAGAVILLAAIGTIQPKRNDLLSASNRNGKQTPL